MTTSMTEVTIDSWDCNTLFIMTAGFDLGHLVGHIALVTWTDVRDMLAVAFPSLLNIYSALVL